MLRRLLVLLVPLAPLLVPSAASALGPYTVTDLGTLGGTTSYGTAINDLGHAVGYSTLPGGETRAFLWTSSGGMQNLGTLDGRDSQALDINNNDNVVGYTSDTGDFEFRHYAFRWTSTFGMVSLDGTNMGSANGLNNSNLAIGERNLPSTVNRTLIWEPANAPTNLYPAFNSKGIAVNDLEQRVSSTSTAGVYNDGTGTALSPLGLIPTDINNSRFITGSTGGIATVLDFDNNILTPLGKLSPTDVFSRALGINAAGTVVGVSQGTGGFIADSTLTSITNLTSLLDPSISGWNILTAEDVNSAGQIIGVGEFGGVSHAVILTPVPEPSSALLALLAGGGMWLLCRRFNRCPLTSLKFLYQVL